MSQVAQRKWNEFFADPHLRALIAQAIAHNQELNIQLQEIIIARNEVAAQRGEYLPRVNGGARAGVEKVGKYTSIGVSNEAHDVDEPLRQFSFGLSASWEVDVWGRLRNAAKAADYRYAATVEAKNFLVTQIIAEIANSYYELLALDSQLALLIRNVEILEDALEVVRLKKLAARATELAVQKFEAEVLENKSRRYEIEQQQVVVENRINFLVGRMPQRVARSSKPITSLNPRVIGAGVPAKLLDNRPDVREAEMQLAAAKLDVKSAKARFYPALSIEADVGYESFNARHLVTTPESLVYNLAANLTAPLLNRAAITADYRSANARQIQAVFNFERTLLLAFTEVVNYLATIERFEKRYMRLSEQVQKLAQAVEVSNILYRTAHADYMEVLMTRRDALVAHLELIETKMLQMQATVDLYQALGGGWRQL